MFHPLAVTGIFSLAATLALAGCAKDRPMLRKGQPAAELAGGDQRPTKTIDGKTISLTRLSGEGPVMLVFLRGFS